MHDREAPGTGRHPRQHASGPNAGQYRVRSPVTTRLAGTGLVADDLYLMAHHEVSGRPVLQPRPLGLGLAGALLAEVMLDGGITVRHDVVLPCNARPADHLALRTWEQIVTEPGPLLLRDWLLSFARGAAADVALRLERAGYLTRVRGWAPWRPARWVPADPDWAFASLLRVRAALDPTRPSGPGEAALTGLAAACGPGFRLAECLTPAGLSLEGTAIAAAIHAGLRRLYEILARLELRRLQDLTRRIRLPLVAIRHLLPDQDDRAAVVLLRDQMPGGSYLVISHATADGQRRGYAHRGPGSHGPRQPATDSRRTRRVGQW